MKSRRLKVAVIGLGSAGRLHCDSIVNSTPEMTLVAVVEAVEPLARAAAEKYGVPAFPAVRDLLKARICDAVTVATPHPSHPVIAIECMKAGLHVLTEKPLAETVGKADRMIRAAKAHRVAFGCVFQRRFEPAVARAIRLVRSGRLGALRRALLVFTDFRSQAYYDSNAWRATWKGEGGGVLLNQAPHFLDIFVQLAGTPETVHGHIATAMHRIEVEDQAEALLTYRGGGTGYVYCSTTEPRDSIRFEIVGENGKLVLREKSLEFFAFRPGLKQLSDATAEMWAQPKVTEPNLAVASQETGHFSVMRNFARHVLRGETLVCSGESALASLELSNAITLSHFQDKAVRLPIDRRAYDSLLGRLQRTSRFRKRRVRVQYATDPRLK